MPPLSNAPHLPNAEATHSNMFNIDAEGRLCCIRHKNEKVPLDRMEGQSQSSNNPGLVRYVSSYKPLCYVCCISYNFPIGNGTTNVHDHCVIP